MRHYNDRYVVNEQGELFSLCRRGLKKLKPYINSKGYVMYRLRVDGKTIQRSAHHLSCFRRLKSAHIPSRETLVEDLLSKKSIANLASKYGISDNAYRKWLIKRGLPTKYKEIKLFLMSV